MTAEKNLIAPESKPYPFCPGCSHSNLFDSLDHVVNQLEINRDKLVIVSDIGCIGIGDKHFTCHTFHGLHGRSITYATGLKLSDPDLHVIVLIGDGGLGIGGTHFLNAARRNLDITVIVANNFNFGMTGGQHSVTTPHESITATTTAGNIENAFDVCGLAAAAGCNFAARTLYIDKDDLRSQLKTAIETPGFSVIDVWELCIPYFTKNNDLNRKRLEAMKDSLGLEHGVLCHKTKKDYGTLLAEQTQASAKPLQSKSIPIQFQSEITEKTNILFAGTAGKKIKSTATLLGISASASDLWVTERNDNPVTIMSGHSVAEMIIHSEPIHNFALATPHYALIISQDGLNKVAEKVKAMPETSTVYTFPEFQDLETNAQVKVIDLSSLDMRIPKAHHAFVLLCFFLQDSKVVSLDALKEALKSRQRGEILEKSLEILEKFT